jgi:hypothetical protein
VSDDDRVLTDDELDMLLADDWHRSDLVTLLDELHDHLTAYVILPTPEAAVAVVLFVAATHAQGAWEHASRLVVKSPIKRCGKTRLQEVVAETAYKVLRTTNISPAALARSIDEDDPPTLILDEADTVFGPKKQRAEGAEDLRGILNSGHSRGWPYVRWDANKRQAEHCATFAMAVIGGIGDMPDTIEDRAVVVSMRRRAPGETVKQWRSRRAVPPLRDLRDRLHACIDAIADSLAEAEPDLPVEDRAADVWEPLVAIADAAGGAWPDRAREACQTLTGEGDRDDVTADERVLADLHDVFGDAEQLSTETILERLHKLEEAPWGDWYGHPLNARDLAKLLKPYKVKSTRIRPDGGDQVRGYTRRALSDAWQRYVLPTSQASQAGEPAVQPRDGNVTDDLFGSVTRSDQRKRDDVTDVTDVTAERPEHATTDVADVAADHATAPRWTRELVPSDCTICGNGPTLMRYDGRPAHPCCMEAQP